MRLEPMQKRTRVYLSPSEYKFLLDCAATRRSYFAARLEAECSPRIGMVADIERDDFFTPATPGVELTFLKLRGAKDTTEGESPLGGQARITWVPDDLYGELMKWADQRGAGAGDQLFDVGPAQLQNDVQKMRETAAQKSGNEDFLHVTSHDFRVYYATHLVRRKRVDVEIVMETGGWSSKEAIEPYLQKPLPKDIQDEYVRSGLVDGEDLPEPPRRDEYAGIYEELRKIRRLLELDGDSAIEQLTAEEIAAIREQILDERGAETEPTLSTLSDFSEEEPAAGDPVSAWTRARLRAEHAAARASDVAEHYPPSPARSAALALGLIVYATVFGVLFAQTGAFYVDIGGGDIHASPGFVLGLGLGAALLYRDLPEL